MSLPLLTAVTPRWESDLALRLGRSDRVHLVRRCADLADLLGALAAGLGQVVVVSVDLRGLDRGVVEELTGTGARVLGVHPPGDEAGERTLRRWGLVAVPADAGTDQLEAALQQLLSSEPPTRATRGLAATPAATPDLASGGRAPSHQPAGQGDGPGSEEPEGAGGPAGGAERPRGQVVAVWGPVGAPGRTTVAVNLAAELALIDPPTVLVDADTYGASVAQALAVLDEAPGVAAAARAADQGRLDQAVLAGLAPEVTPGLRVLTGMPRADRWPELREQALADVLAACAALWPWTVVDLASCLEQDEELTFDTRAPRRNGAALTVLEAADRVVVVGTADPIGLQRLVRGLDLLAGACSATRTVVVTRVRAGSVGTDPARRVRDALHRFAGLTGVLLVPEDQAALDAALLAGRALHEVRPTSPARTALRELAGRLSGAGPSTFRRRLRWREPAG